MTELPDRRVHARLPDNWELVRYDRAGKWWVEGYGPRGGQRRNVTFKVAVACALSDGAAVNYGMAGGSRFDSAVRKARTA